MKRILFPVIIFLFAASASAQDPQNIAPVTEVWNPKVRVVDAGKTDALPPSDAIVLFDGKNTSAWKAQDGGHMKWKVSDGILTVTEGSGFIITKQGFGDCRLHIEWRTPAEVKYSGQNRGNSGILLMGKYELQVLDSYVNPTYSNGQAGSMYKQLIPLVNSSRKPGEWQTYDVVFIAPIFNKDSLVKSPATVTIFHNGVLVQNHGTLFGTTEYLGIGSYHMHSDKEPLLLQNHGSPVSYRNIWIREL
ncbi:MAG: DUF1080 domain-containing protein [Ginsengibacter sp.]